MARPPKSKAIERLRKALDSIPRLKQLQRNSLEFQKWRRDTQVAITHTFGGESGHIQDFNNVEYWSWSTQESSDQIAYLRGLDSAASVLESMIDEIEEYWQDEQQTPPSSAAQANERTNTNEIFVIPGRDEGTRAMVARFLEQLNLKPVILEAIS